MSKWRVENGMSVGKGAIQLDPKPNQVVDFCLMTSDLRHWASSQQGNEILDSVVRICRPLDSIGGYFGRGQNASPRLKWAPIFHVS